MVVIIPLDLGVSEWADVFCCCKALRPLPELWTCDQTVKVVLLPKKPKTSPLTYRGRSNAPPTRSDGLRRSSVLNTQDPGLLFRSLGWRRYLISATPPLLSLRTEVEAETERG